MQKVTKIVGVLVVSINWRNCHCPISLCKGSQIKQFKIIEFVFKLHFQIYFGFSCVKFINPC
jgi:hypothetical protein